MSTGEGEEPKRDFRSIRNKVFIRSEHRSNRPPRNLATRIHIRTQLLAHLTEHPNGRHKCVWRVGGR